MNQQDALAILKAGFSVFLTGQAGAGKTYLLNQYIAYLRQHKIPVAITASTGIAATHMNGMTIHSWAGIGIKDIFEPSDFKNLANREGFVEKIRQTKVVIIDEISMLHARQLDLVNDVLQRFCEDDRPFGGKQVIFAGDFFQLPPIGKKDESTKDKFAFMSKAWIEMATSLVDNAPKLKVCYLDEQHRQTHTQGELSLVDILNQIRCQNIDKQAIDSLHQTKFNTLDDNRIRLYTHNANVDKINQDELQKINKKSYDYQAVFDGNEKYQEMLIKNVRSPELLQLKVGAKVMFTKNNSTEQYYNGTMGVVVQFKKSLEFLDINPKGEFPVVKLNNGRTIYVLPESWQIDSEDGSVLAELMQLPLTLAWAITVHKSQGMTLDAAEIDLSKTFEKGQGYVALSRIKALDGLKLLGLNQTSLLLDEFAQKANKRFYQLSCECQAWLKTINPKQLEQWQTQFITDNQANIATNKNAKTNGRTTNNATANNYIKQAIQSNHKKKRDD